MQRVDNIEPLLTALDNEKLAKIAAEALSSTLLMFDNFHDVAERAKAGNVYAKQVLQSWADAQWFLSRPKLAEKLTVTVFKVTGETNTDDLSPAQDAWSRPGYLVTRSGNVKKCPHYIQPDDVSNVGPIKQLRRLVPKGFPCLCW